MSKIEWCDESWQPVVGCTKVSVGCENCYAEKMAFRLGCINPISKYREVISYEPMPAHWNGKTVCDESALKIPLHWRKPRKIFVCSMGDLFHSSVPFGFIDEVMAVFALCPQHTFQILTKRPERIAKYYADEYPRRTEIRDAMMEIKGSHCLYKSWPLPNLWLGVTIEHPDYKGRADILRQIPAAVRFVSIEPCLSDMGELNLKGISWVIVGSESGAGARFCPVENIRGVVKQCQDAGVPVFVKQIHLNDKAKAIKDIKQFPIDLRIREYPK